MENRPKQTDQKKLEKTAAIGKMAAALFNQKGYLETSMDDISVTAQLSKGGIYHYFSSKHEILYFISTSYMDLLLKDLEQELEKIDDHFSKIR
jgi:AcrR family transcriptional regulator